jgi:hypothetical protein
MDLLFVPGDSDAEKAAKKFFPKRPGAKLITPRGVKNHLAGFLDTLGASSSGITPPIGDIIIFAHGGDDGHYSIPLTGSVPSPADFEKVVDADKADKIRIDAALVTPSGGGAQNTITVRLMGCNVGQARLFMEKFQSAMTPKGGAIKVIAPLHFDEIDNKYIRGGLVEYLAHNFTLRVKDKFKDRDALVDAFDQATPKLTYLDGTKIPKEAWKDWVPENIHPPAASWQQRFFMFVDLDPAANGQTHVKIHGEYRFRMLAPPIAPFAFTLRASDPGNDHDRIELLRKSLPKAANAAGLKLYDPNYPLPLWKRWGFSKLDDFVDNLNWHDDTRTTKGEHHFTASMPEYTVMLPVTDPPGAAVPPNPPPTPKMKFYNFYPDGAGTADMHIDEANNKLYLIL